MIVTLVSLSLYEPCSVDSVDHVFYGVLTSLAPKILLLLLLWGSSELCLTFECEIKPLWCRFYQNRLWAQQLSLGMISLTFFASHLWFYLGSLGCPASRSILTCWSVSPAPTQYFKNENCYSKESHPMCTGCTLNLGTFHWTERMLFSGRGEETRCELPLQVHQTPPPGHSLSLSVLQK